ncbi:hypothetical protein NMY22_g19560 [Coprinellus aureogranulatus]|nr:hypothetical protein NMY22_g19560 [Coprinellus aureogranulatus]
MSVKPSEPFEAPSMKQPKPWKCGQTHNFPLPTPNDDPWTQLLKPLLEKDAERCKVWKDEVSNILIFAGLFSAVVTAFIIESYKSLRKDPVEVMLEYLVANRLGDQASPPLTTDISSSA